MKTLEQIKNEFAFTVGFSDWRELFLNSDLCFESFEYYENQVMKIYAMECLKLASENASMVAVSNENGGRNIVINKETIINENNIIK